VSKGSGGVLPTHLCRLPKVWCGRYSHVAIIRPGNTRTDIPTGVDYTPASFGIGFCRSGFAARESREAIKWVEAKRIQRTKYVNDGMTLLHNPGTGESHPALRYASNRRITTSKSNSLVSWRCERAVAKRVARSRYTM
jgi:hypothetical protein